MKTTFTTILLAMAFAAVPALAAHTPACGNDAQTVGLKARLANLSEKMDRIQWATDPAEQRRLMDLHAKLMREGLEQIRTRPISSECRMQMTQAMMDQIILHELAEQETQIH